MESTAVFDDASGGGIGCSSRCALPGTSRVGVELFFMLAVLGPPSVMIQANDRYSLQPATLISYQIN